MPHNAATARLAKQAPAAKPGLHAQSSSTPKPKRVKSGAAEEGQAPGDELVPALQAADVTGTRFACGAPQLAAQEAWKDLAGE